MAIPAVAIKAGVKIIATLLPDSESLIKFLGLFILLPIILLSLLIVIPNIVTRTLPMAEPEQLQLYVDIVNDIDESKNVNINWQYVVAIDAVLLQQDFSKATPSHIEEIANKFLKPNGKGYTIRSLNEVLNILIDEGLLTRNNIKDVDNYMQADLITYLPVIYDGDFTPSMDGEYIWPVPAKFTRISSPFGPRKSPTPGASTFHKGLDIPVPIGTPVYASKDGTVCAAGVMRGYGNAVWVDHGNGIITRYGHLSTIMAHLGKRVKKGDLVALSGNSGISSGPHLHFEIRKFGNAVNPIPYLAK